MAGSTALLRTGQNGAFLLVIPILWAIGLLMWIGFGMADFIWPKAFGPKGNGSALRPVAGSSSTLNAERQTRAGFPARAS